MDNISRVKINFKGENIPYGTIPYGKDSLILLLSVDILTESKTIEE